MRALPPERRWGGGASFSGYSQQTFMELVQWAEHCEKRHHPCLQGTPRQAGRGSVCEHCCERGTPEPQPHRGSSCLLSQFIVIIIWQGRVLVAAHGSLIMTRGHSSCGAPTQ